MDSNVWLFYFVSTRKQRALLQLFEIFLPDAAFGDGSFALSTPVVGYPPRYYTAEFNIPKKVYVDDSHNISVTISPEKLDSKRKFYKRDFDKSSGLKPLPRVIIHKYIGHLRYERLFVRKEEFQDEKLFLELVNNQILIQDKGNPDHFYFNEKFEDENALIERLRNVNIFNTEPIVAIWENSLIGFSDQEHEDCFIEVELLAAGMEVDGDKKQRCSLFSLPHTYIWNCHFSKSGNQKINLIFRTISSGRSDDIYHEEYTIKVVKLDHLTRRQVWLLASIATAISFILGIAKGIGLLSLLR